MTALRAALLALVAATSVRAQVASPEGQAFVKAQLKDILPSGRVVRDYAPFETERGEGALLVLTVTGADPDREPAYPPEPTCAERVEGAPLTGIYGLALVLRGTFVNEVAIPSDGSGAVGPLALPVRNRVADDIRFWNAPAAALDPPDAVEPTRLVRLVDYDGDGSAFELRLVRPTSCGHVLTLLAGYSPRRREAVVFAVEDEHGTTFWARDAFPGVGELTPGRLTRRTGCEAGARVETKLRFDAARELWRAVASRRTPCAG